MGYRVSVGDLHIAVDTDHEFAHVVRVLTDENVPIPTEYGTGTAFGGGGGSGGLRGT